MSNSRINTDFDKGINSKNSEITKPFLNSSKNPSNACQVAFLICQTHKYLRARGYSQVSGNLSKIRT